MISNAISKTGETAIRLRQAALKNKLKELTALSRRRDDLDVEIVADALDRVVSAAERELAVTKLEGTIRLARDVRAALDRSELGTYGVCEDCEEPIPAKRLDAVPWARFCVRCQSAVEARSAVDERYIGEAA